ncbi:MAG: fumarylacetoacetate hydrolase family protein [Paracoccaceae bacterium]|nr:fumarylacetoacetate hydrolase family protein [Paracoccaceae bacterium]
MKLMRLGARGRETPCVEDATGVLRDVSAVVPDFTPTTIPTLLETLSAQDLTSLPSVSHEGVRIGAPIARPHNVWCIGLNYSDHAEEANMPVPDEPILFTKPSSTVCGPNDSLLLPPESRKMDWEVELGVVISKPVFEIDKASAMDHVLGFTIVNDVSEREWQLERGGQWSKGKGYPNFCPTGPWLITTDAVADPGDLAMSLTVNGETMQDGTTRTMIFDVPTIVYYLSRFCLLEPGDLICTGTPPGVGMGQKPQRYLQVGDEISLTVEGLGRQTQRVQASSRETR